MVPYLGALLQRVGNMCDESAGLCSYLASLNTEAAIDAMRSVSMGTREDGHRAADGDRNIQRRAALDQRVPRSPHRMRPVGIPMRMAPRIISRAGHGHLKLQLFVVGQDVCIGDRPVCANSIARIHFEVRRMKSRCKRRPVNRSTANALATVVGPSASGSEPPVTRGSVQ